MARTDIGRYAVNKWFLSISLIVYTILSTQNIMYIPFLRARQLNGHLLYLILRFPHRSVPYLHLTYR